MQGMAGADSPLPSPAIFALRLYREIKSWPSPFDADTAVDVVCLILVPEGIAIWGWKDGGGCESDRSVY